MRYKKYYNMIMTELQAHKNDIDSLSTRYLAEKKAFEDRLSEMEGTYTEEYINETRKNWTSQLNYSATMDNSRVKHGAVIDFCLGVIGKQLNNYFNAPIKKDFADKITTIKLSGLQLTDRELELLQQEATSYIERRLLNEIAVTRTEKKSKYTSEGIEISEETNAYLYVELPDIEQTYGAFKDFSSLCRFMIANYCGENNELFQLLGNDTPYYVAISADTIIRDKTTKDNFVNIMEKAISIMPQPKTELTEQEVKLIDCLIDSRYPSIAKQKVIEIANNSEELAELLRLDKRYCEYLEDNE